MSRAVLFALSLSFASLAMFLARQWKKKKAKEGKQQEGREGGPGWTGGERE
jgi:hypothetical protein